MGPPILDTTISLGNLITAGTTLVSVLGAWWGLKGKVQRIEGEITHVAALMQLTLNHHDAQLKDHSTKLDQLEGIATTQAGMLQRVIGQLEMSNRNGGEDFGRAERRGRQR